MINFVTQSKELLCSFETKTHQKGVLASENQYYYLQKASRKEVVNTKNWGISQYVYTTYQ